MNDRHLKKSITLRPDEDILEWMQSRVTRAHSVNAEVNRLLRAAIDAEESNNKKIDAIITRLDTLEKTLIDEIRKK